MTKHAPKKESEAPMPSLLDDVLDGRDPQVVAKEWADEATKFVQRNPWVAVAGAVAIGYFLGSISGRRRQDPPR